MGIARLLLWRFNSSAYTSDPFRIPRLFSTSAAMIRRPWIDDLGELEESLGESEVYRRALKFQRPSTVRFQENMLNSVRLIGFIDAPFKNFDTASGRICVFTTLKVDSSTRAHRNFTVLLDFWDELAEVAVEHLKLRDLIYVSGSLVSYKMEEDGKSIYRHKVNVAEVNFIIQQAAVSPCENSLKLKPKATLEDILRRRKARLRLWQVFFSSPDEWWDDRNNKRNPKQPDFKHKDTGEALWLNDYDPPWVRKQLVLHDSRMKQRGSKKHMNTLSRLSHLVSDDTSEN